MNYYLCVAALCVTQVSIAMDWKTPQEVARKLAYIERIYQAPRVPLVIEQQRLDSARTKLTQKYQQQCIGVRWGVCFFSIIKHSIPSGMPQMIRSKPAQVAL